MPTFQYINLGETGQDLVTKWKNNFDLVALGAGGVGYIIQPTDAIDSSAWWTTMSSTYRTFSIINDKDFGGVTVTLPSGITLLFNGGVWSNGTIVGNNTILFIYGIQQAFETNLIFSGTWSTRGVCPEYYGAITNANTGIFDINDCSAEIQACLDSPFNVFFNAGFYYISSGVVIGLNKNIQTLGGYISSYTEGMVSVADHTRIYTDKNIDLFTIRSGFSFLGFGVLDAKAAIDSEYHTKGVFTFDLNYSCGPTRIDANIIGNIKSNPLVNTVGQGTIAINIDDSVTTGNPIWGYIYGLELNLNVFSVRKAVYISSSNVGRTGDFVVWGKWNIYTTAAKQAYDLHGGSLIYIIGANQASPVIPVAETSLPAAFIGSHSTLFSADMVDYGLTNTNIVPVANDGIYNQFIQSSKILDYYNRIEWENGTFDLGIFNTYKCKYPERALYYNKFQYVPTATILPYDGSAYDFDTNLDNSLGVCPPTSNILLGGTADFFKIRGERVTVQFINAPTKLTDFIEVVIPITNINLINQLYYYLFVYPSKPIRIQTIIKKPTGDIVHNMYPGDEALPPEPVIYQPFIDDITFSGLPINTVGITELIVRFIGCNDISNIYLINQIFISDIDPLNLPSSNNIIDIQGGQTIFGNLTLSGTLNGLSLTDGADIYRLQVRGGKLCVDKTLTGIGFPGLEDTDWTKLFEF
jgi:hypothetical protein